MKSKIYVIRLIIFIPIIHLLLTLCIVKFINNYDSMRIPNIRLIPKISRKSIVSNFIDSKHHKFNIVLLGDSQTNGYLYPKNQIFSTLLGRKLNQTCLNLAFIDSKINDNIIILNKLLQNQEHPKILIFSVNLSHIGGNEQKNHLDTVDKNYIIEIFLHLKSFIKFCINTNPTKKPKFGLSEMIVSKDWLTIDNLKKKAYLLKLKILIEKARLLTNNHVIIYINPLCYNKVNSECDTKYNALSDVKEEIKKVSLLNGAIFLESNIHQNKYFFDIIHLNNIGHIKMANFLSNQIKYRERLWKK